MRLPGQPASGLSNLNENMYLVVRSLKHNNDKIVSKLTPLVLLLRLLPAGWQRVTLAVCVRRTTRFRRRIF